MRPRFRFTLDGNKSISDPIGWDKLVIDLDRDPQYRSLIEVVTIPLEFAGDDGRTDGGYDYLKEAKANGVDTQIEFLSEISVDGGSTWETIWDGLLAVHDFIEIESRRKIQATLKRGGMWSKFINRKSVPVDVRSALNLDGDAVGFLATATNMPISSQEVRKTFRSEQWPAADSNYFRIRYQTTSTNAYGTIELPKEISNEFEEKFTLVNGVSDTPPVPLIIIKERGDYTFDVQLALSSHDAATAGIVPPTNIFVYLQINDDSPIAFTKTVFGTSLVDERAVFTYSAMHTLSISDEIRIWFQNDNATGDMSILQQDLFENSWIDIHGETLAPDSFADGFFIHNAAAAITRRITGELSFYSEFFGSPETQEIVYGLAGCGSDHHLFGARNFRGESLTQKPFSMSFDDLWEGLNPIFNLGIGYERINVNLGGGGVGKEMIRAEEVDYFFDDSSTSLELYNVGDKTDDIEILYDKDFLLTSIENGYQKWESESFSGNDDPQTQQTRGTRFKIVGDRATKDFKGLSSLYAASIGIEQTRRLQFQSESKDWRLDEEMFIIETNGNDSVKLYDPSDITGLLNAGTRYNVRLTPASNLYRWRNWLSIGFQDYIGDVFRFTKGEGNTNMVYNNASPAACEPGGFAQENGDITIIEGLFLPIIYRFSHPLTWEEYKAVRDNKTKSIGVQYIDNTGTTVRIVAFIKKLSFAVNEGMAKFEVWPKTLPVAEEPAEPVDPGTYDILTTQTATAGVIYEYIWPTQGTFGIDGTDSVAHNDQAYTISTIQVEVSKSSNGGVAEGDVTITYFKNTIQVHQDLVSSGNPVNETYTFTAVIADDELEVVTVEL